MKKEIQFYGCSYSDGGGMDTNQFYDWFKNEKWVNEYPKENRFEIDGFDIEFKNYFRFSNIIERKTNYQINNNSCTGNNNQNIFDVLINNLEHNKGDIHVVQWSHFHRQKLWYEPNRKYYRLSGFEKDAVGFEGSGDKDEYGELTDFHNQWLKNHFNEEYERSKVINYTKLLTAYSNEKDIPIYFITWDYLPYKNEKFIDFSDDLNENPLGHYVGIQYDLYGKEYTIEQRTNYDILDGHLSYEGNLMVAEKIINRLKQDELL